MNIEVKATFKAANIKENGCIMQFELESSSLSRLPELVGYTGKYVFLTLDTGQEELPLEMEVEGGEEIEAEVLSLPEGKDGE